MQSTFPGFDLGLSGVPNVTGEGLPFTVVDSLDES